MRNIWQKLKEGFKKFFRKKLAVFLTEEYLNKRAEKASKEKFKAALESVPDIAPDEIDKL